jgi:hypothetical protein
MGYFDGLTNASFRKDAQGRDVFYPHGVFGRGRIIPDAETALRLRRSMKRFYIALLVVFLPVIVVANLMHVSFVALVLLALAAMAVSVAYVLHLARGLPFSDERLTYKESLQNSARGHNKVGLILLAILSALFVALGVFILSLDPAENLWLGLACILLFGFCLIMFLRMLIAKARQERAGKG